MIKNLISQLIKKKRGSTILKKVWRRFFNVKINNSYSDWLKDNSSDWKELLKSIDRDLYLKTKEKISLLELENYKILKKVKYDLGGSANQNLLYFFVRYFKPSIIIETGVAAGHSSKAILTAIHENNKGILYSSDFPYFRLYNPEKYIGILVKNELIKKNWILEIEGDEINLPKILDQIEKIDIFHYDSDKSYLGKFKTFNSIKSKLHSNSIIIFDDIQDDRFFKELTEITRKNYYVLPFKNKYIGIIGNLN